MRIVVYGVGAIGGVVAAALAAAGRETVGIARGAQLDALRTGPLRLRHPGGTVEARLPVVADPAEIDWRPDDAILLAMKSQHCLPALEALRAAGVSEQPIFCGQNGVANERMALRLFPNVHGVTVLMPATYVTPGEVVCYSSPRYGIFELGRCPLGTDAADAALAEALEAANIAAFPMADVMAGKYGKLVMNLRNIVEAALGRGAEAGDLPARLAAEAEAVYAAAGISWRSVDLSDPRRQEFMRMGEVDGAPRLGGSTTQSLTRRTGSVETDYLNGEIALLGRLHGVPTPLNAGLTHLAARLAREGAGPGTMTLAELEAML